MMKNLYHFTVRTASEGRGMIRLLRSPLPTPLKSKILKTELVLGALRLRNTSDSTVRARVLDFEVRAYSLPDLAMLHREIFTNAEYFFLSERPDPFILDCGSNIGMSILFFKALYPEARIIGFEPAEHTYGLLKQNISSNDLKGVEVHRAALGMEDSTVDFFVYPENQNSFLASTIRDRMPHKRTSVQQVRLSRFIDREVDLLKLDVEGAEDAVLKELMSSGAISKIDQMIVEYHHHIDEKKDIFSSFLGGLEETGFGYQISTSFNSPNSARISRGRTFQDILVYAYRKSPPLASATTSS